MKSLSKVFRYKSDDSFKMCEQSIEYALNNKEFLMKIKSCKNKFGDGKSSKRIVQILKELKFDIKLIQKQITY